MINITRLHGQTQITMPDDTACRLAYILENSNHFDQIEAVLLMTMIANGVYPHWPDYDGMPQEPSDDYEWGNYGGTSSDDE